MIDPLEKKTFLATVGTVERDVANDMSAIFGSEARAPTPVSPVGDRGGNRFAIQRPALVTAFVSVLAVTIAAGVYAGNSVTATPAATPASQAATRSARSLDRHETELLPIDPTAGVAVPSPLPPSAGAASPVPIRGTSPALGTFASANEPRALPREPAVQPAANLILRRSFPVTAAASAHPNLTTSLWTNCDEDSDECDVRRIDDAEQRVANAYAQAVEAGVRSRDLRGYRGEWDRARDEATDQPRNALRLYAMVTSDLLNLAEDAGPRDGSTER